MGHPKLRREIREERDGRPKNEMSATAGVYSGYACLVSPNEGEKETSR